jgi:hypothetical protein
MEYAGRMILCGVRVYHAVLDFVGWFVPDEITYTSSWRICNPSTHEYILSDTREELCFSDEYSLMIHYVRRVNGLQEELRCAVHWPEFHREGYRVHDLFESMPAPWLFIGYREGEDTIDCTDMISQFVCGGNVIHLDLLNYMFPESNGKQWVYINTKTFEETEFPSDGIVIGEDGVDQESGDKKND